MAHHQEHFRCKVHLRNLNLLLQAHPKRTFDDGVEINFKDKTKCDYKDTISKFGKVIKYGYIEKKIPINCEEMKYYEDEEEFSQEDESDDDKGCGGEERKVGSQGKPASQL